MKNSINTKNVTEAIRLTSIFALVAAPLCFDAWNATFICVAAIYSYISASFAQDLHQKMALSSLKSDKEFEIIKKDLIIGLTPSDHIKEKVREAQEKLQEEINSLPNKRQITKRSFIPLNGFRKSPL